MYLNNQIDIMPQINQKNKVKSKKIYKADHKKTINQNYKVKIIK
jgi:hypothetical protein